MTEDPKSYIKLIGSKEKSVSIMFRPTHLVILFAVVLCATALPADPAPKEPAKVGAPVRVQDAGEKGAEEKSDLATDAQTYWSYRYTYDVPKLEYITDGLVARTYNWAPYSWTPYSGYYYAPAVAPVIVAE